MGNDNIEGRDESQDRGSMHGSGMEKSAGQWDKKGMESSMKENDKSGNQGSNRESWGSGSRAAHEEGSMHAGTMGGMAKFQQYLHSVKYPAAKQDMIDVARSNRAPDDIISLMNKLPEKTYKAPDDVEKEFMKIM